MLPLHHRSACLVLRLRFERRVSDFRGQRVTITPPENVYNIQFGRSEWIRTTDPSRPRRVQYLTVLHSDQWKRKGVAPYVRDQKSKIIFTRFLIHFHMVAELGFEPRSQCPKNTRDTITLLGNMLLSIWVELSILQFQLQRTQLSLLMLALERPLYSNQHSQLSHS